MYVFVMTVRDYKRAGTIYMAFSNFNNVTIIELAYVCLYVVILMFSSWTACVGRHIFRN